MLEPMRVAEYDRFGRAAEVTVVRERPPPRASLREVMVKVRAAALNPKDVILRGGKVPLLALSGFPRQLGYDFAGEVESVGNGESGVRAGDAVFGMLNGNRGGTLAEYCLVPEDELAPKPARLSWEEAAALPLTALTALQALRDDAKLQVGQRVLINGASGGVGVAAIQIAKALGAHVTSVTSAQNRALCSSLGSDVWLDYARGRTFDGEQNYDVIFDVFGDQTLASVKRALSARGQYVTTVPKARIFLDSARTLLSAQRAHLVMVRSRARDLRVIAELVEQGKLRAIVHGIYPLEQAVQAQEQVESKHSRGKVVVRL
jgi:NADPH:quinone reductase-like Zn-dependent oxidoreductase